MVVARPKQLITVFGARLPQARSIGSAAVPRARDDYATAASSPKGARFAKAAEADNITISYFYEVWLSLVERYVRDVEAASSNLVTSTKKRKDRYGVPAIEQVRHWCLYWFGCENEL